MKLAQYILNELMKDHCCSQKQAIDLMRLYYPYLVKYVCDEPLPQLQDTHLLTI